MFKIGETIIYPMHGTCVIESIEEKEILGESQFCYILNIPQAKMQITIPMENAWKVGIREVVDIEILENILSNFYLEDTDPGIFDNHRYCTDINKKRIKSGDIHKGTEIIRDLTRKKIKKSKLGSVDSTMLNNARQIFVSELMEVKGLGQEQAVYLLNEVLSSM